MRRGACRRRGFEREQGMSSTMAIEPKEVFDHVQLSSIKSAADIVAETLGARKEKEKLIVARAVFDIAAETGVFDVPKLVEMARERLTPKLGWRFS
jgi:hypothetical protein